MNSDRRKKLLIIAVFTVLAVICGYFIEKHSNTGFVTETATEEEMRQYNDSDGRIKDGKININSADAGLLDNLEGIGEKTARSIVEYREANGPFGSIDELKNIDGIGDRTVEAVRDKICAE